MHITDLVSQLPETIVVLPGVVVNTRTTCVDYKAPEFDHAHAEVKFASGDYLVTLIVVPSERTIVEVHVVTAVDIKY